MVAVQTSVVDQVGAAEYLTPEFLTWVRTATTEINKHTNDHGRCLAGAWRATNYVGCWRWQTC